ncbi:hypothetical protein [Paraliomyxa miuraensis]|uniref:hypothetical protein n=1 Tax=Paraliomyxa miuraensis TaxID=376150 RepID=UPI0022520DB4|nr:hypothetical protein [Paraliomyxa miuraensis]MCX4246181.1 hypothetical protein [Paraliomyxa miuraensis]
MIGPSMALWLTATIAEPAAVTVPLEWSAPSQCPAGREVGERLARALAESAADPRGMRARASITEGERGVLTLELTLERDDGPVGQRTMQASDCDELANAAVLVVALAVDPEARPEPKPSPNPPPDPPPDPGAGSPDSDVPEPHSPPKPPPADVASAEEPEPGPAGSATDSTPTERAPASSTHVGLRASAGVGVATLPRTTAVISLAAATWGRAWRAELGASYWTPTPTDPTGGRIQQWTIDARGCGLLRPGPLELPLCGGLDAGAVHGEGVGVLAPRRAASLRLAAGLGAALVWRPARWQQRVGPWLGADLLIALVRARFRATPTAAELVYYTPPVGARFAAGMEVRFR